MRCATHANGVGAGVNRTQYQGEDPIACPVGSYNPLVQQDDQADCGSCPPGFYCDTEVRFRPLLRSNLSSGCSASLCRLSIEKQSSRYVLDAHN